MTTTTVSPGPTGPETAPRPQPEQQRTPEDRIELFLPDLDEERVGLLDDLNTAYHQHKDELWRREYNELDNDAVSKRLRPGESLVDAKQRIADRYAAREAIDATQEHIEEELMPIFAEGIDKNDPRYTEILESLMYVSTLDEEKWRGEEDEDGNRDPGLRDILLTHAREDNSAAEESTAEEEEASQPESETDDTEISELERQLRSLEENDPAYREAREKLSGLRNSLAALTAKELGKPWSLRSGKYKQAKAAYNEQLVKVGKMVEGHMSAVFPDRDEPQKRTDVIAYLLAEQSELRSLTRDNFADTKRSKFVEWFNRGGKGARFGKGLIISAPAAVFAAVAAPAGVAVGAATMGIMGTRFTRSYARHDKDRGTVIGADPTVDKNHLHHEMETNDANNTEIAVDYLDQNFDNDKKEEQKKRKKAVAWGLGGIAAGTALGALVDQAGDISPRIPGWMKPSLNPDIDAREVPGPGADTGQEGDAPESREPVDREHPDVLSPGELIDRSEFNAGAQTIERGEGWYHTFEEMGVPTDKRDELLNIVGPQLVEQGIAYEDPSIGGYGINMTPEGHMPEEALRMIAETAHQHDINTSIAEQVDTYTIPDEERYHPELADIDEVYESYGSTLPTDAEVGYSSDGGYGVELSEVDDIHSGEGWSDTMREMGVPAADRARLLELAGPQLVEHSVGYVDHSLPGSSHYGIRMTPSGNMPTEALHILHDTARHNGIPMHYRP